MGIGSPTGLIGNSKIHMSFPYTIISFDPEYKLLHNTLELWCDLNVHNYDEAIVVFLRKNGESVYWIDDVAPFPKLHIGDKYI